MKMIGLGLLCVIFVSSLIILGVVRAAQKERSVRITCLSEYRQRGKELSDKCFVYLLEKGYLKLEGK